jgi:hypothetical protein
MNKLRDMLSDLLTDEYDIRESELNTGNYPGERVRILNIAETEIKALMLEVFVDALHDANTFSELADKFHEGIEAL